MSDESRNYDRLPMEHLIEFSEYDFSGSSTVIPSKLKDVSGGGVQFESSQYLELGTVLKMKLNIPGWDKHKTEFLKADWQSATEPLVTLGKVVRVERGRGGTYDVGVAFECIDEDHRNAVMKYIEDLKQS